MSGPTSTKFSQIDIEKLTEVIVDACDIENLCADEVVQNYISGSISRIEAENARLIESASLNKYQQDIENNGQVTSQTGIVFDQTETQNGENTQLDINGQAEVSSLFGKRNIFINQSILGNTYTDYLSASFLKENTISNLDPLRSRIGAYWSLNASLELDYLKKYSEVNEHSVLKYDENSLSINGSFKNNLKVSPTDISTYGNFEEKYLLYFKKRDFDNDENLINSFSSGGRYKGPLPDLADKVDITYIATVQTGIEFRDFSFLSYFPYSKKELEQVEVPLSSLTYEIKPDYMFYVDRYENLINENQEIEEKILPNLYLLESNKKIKDPTQTIKNSSKIYTETINEQFFENFILNYNRLSETQKSEIEKQNKNIIFSAKEVKNLSTYAEKKFMHPMHVQIKFACDKTSILSSILDVANLNDKVIANIAQKIDRNQQAEETFYVQSTETSKKNSLANLEFFKEEKQQTIKYLDFQTILSESKNNENFIDVNDCVYIGDKQGISNLNQTVENKFLNTLYFSIFSNKLTDFLKQKTRTHRMIINGDLCYTETFLYRIAKYRGTNTQIDPIQNIYILNDGELDQIDYIDTQVKYDEQYTYVVYSYQVVVGNKYKYTDPESGGSIDSKRIVVENEPYLLLAEVPVITKTTQIYDSPPAPPEVEIIDFKDNDKEILLLLNSSANTYKASPIIVEEADIEIYTKVSQKQEVEFGEKIEFSTDDPISYYEIYRVEDKPVDYRDFSGQVIRVVNTQLSAQTSERANAAAFKDTILPNKKYYYMFRSIDIHGKPSNPSTVYEVEIINEKGTIFALVSPIVLKQETNTTTRRQVKRFIQIIPSMMQTILNEEDQAYQNAASAKDVLDKSSLGIVESPVWGKKFKIRLVSKQTKKTIDFNVKFDFVTKK
jgi:hypothetical protein